MRISDCSSDVCSSDLSAEKTVKLVAMDPTSAASTSTLSASGTDPDATICQTRPRFGSQVARMKKASPTADARMTYRASVKTCLSARTNMVRSEERRVGKVCVHQGRFRWWPYH